MGQQVVSADGTVLAVEQNGNQHGPVLVCVHGYPDNRSLWNAVAGELSAQYRVVTYDVRGAGQSEAPTRRSAYHLDRLAEDLAAIIDTVSPREPVHLLAHDWGSIQAWHALTGQWLAGRVTSYTSISGPSLDHVGAWMRARLRPQPTALRELLGQLLHSTYIGFFHLPRIPELAWRSGAMARIARLLDGTAQNPDYADARNGLALYRENMLGRLSRPRPLCTDVPVQVLAPSKDAFVTPALQTGIGEWVSDLRVRHVPGGHWLPRAHPDAVAAHVAEFATHVANR